MEAASRTRPLTGAEAAHFEALGAHLVQWHLRHLSELSRRLPEVLRAYARRIPNKSNGHVEASSPRVAVLVSCTPETAGSRGCRLSAGLWQCYAHRHGYSFIYDTSEFPVFPKMRFGHPFDPPLTAVDAEFGNESARFLEETPPSDALTFKWWQRWYAARRHLPYFDLLAVVDADTAVCPACMGTSLLEALGLPPSKPEAWPGVLTRDLRHGEDLNGGVFVFTRSPWGMLHLDLLLAKSRWPVDVAGSGGWCHSRQGAELETFLEVASLELAARTGRPFNQTYQAKCLAHALPEVYALPASAHDRDKEWGWGCVYQRYLNCWRDTMENLAGPPGQRSTKHVRLLDPALVELNYRPWSHEPRYGPTGMKAVKAGAPPFPIARSAFLWHYVGVQDKVGGLLRDFGLRSIEDTLDCERLAKSAKDWTTEESGKACQLGGSRQPCPLGDPSDWRGAIPGIPIWGC